MKLSNLVILFCIIVISVIVVLDQRMESSANVATQKIQYSRAIDNSIDEALDALVEWDSADRVQINKDEAVERFFNSMYCNFGVMHDPEGQDRIQLYTPICAVIETDGFYVYHQERVQMTDALTVQRRWTEKIPFSYDDGTNYWAFSLNDQVRVVRKSDGSILVGDIDDLWGSISSPLKTSSDYYEGKKREIIIQTIKEELAWYVNHHNEIANLWGISYSFSLPDFDGEDLFRSVDNVSFLAVFQGYPYSEYSRDTYNRFAFGGAQLAKESQFYVQAGGEGVKYYHLYDCPQCSVHTEVYKTMKEASEAGARPCPECIGGI